MSKQCSSCKDTQPMENFYRSKAQKSGRESRCKSCEQTRSKEKNFNVYGMTREDYDALLASQGGGCAICGVKSSGRYRHDVDHCHATGRIRGVLCRKCNVLLGMVDDDAELLRRACEYLTLP